MIRGKAIKPKNEFSFIRLPGRHQSERPQLLENFDFGSSPSGGRHDVLFYRLLRSPSDPPEGRDSVDWVDALGANEYQKRVNEIAKDVVEMSRRSSSIDTTTRKEWGQYLNVIEFGGGIGQALECLQDDEFYFRELVSPEALEASEGSSIPPFGVFLKGNFRAGNNQDPEELVLFVRIPYLGQQKSLESSEPQESWSLSQFISQTVTGQEDNPLEDDELSVHQAIFAVLNNAAMLVSKSKEDKGTGMVSLKQDREGAFHVLVHMISEALCRGDGILAALESQATRFEFKSFRPDDGSSREKAGRIMERIAAIKVLVAQQREILETLKDTFGRVVPDLNVLSVHSNKYTENMLFVPVLSGPAGRTESSAEGTKGQMFYVAATLEKIIKKRRQFSEALEKTRVTMTTIDQAQGLKKELSEQAQAQERQAQVLRDQAQAQAQHAQEQRIQAQALQDEIEFQGKALSAFTIVNVLFLPLAFFTQASTTFTSYFSAGDKNLRNGAIGTSIELFWAVTAPCTLLIGVVALYYVLKSKYEPRQFRRLFIDMFRLRWKWPITRADANFQKNYLRKLRKYRVLAVPVGPGGNSQPGGEFYLKNPKLAPHAGEDEFPLQVENTAYPDEFRFDEKNGWLFRDDVDDYDYMYYARTASPSVPPGGEKLSLSWKRSRMVMDKEPYRFKGAFQAERGDSGTFLEWRICGKGGNGCLKPRWDTKDIISVGAFTIEPGVHELKLSVGGLAPPAATATSAGGPGSGSLYKLKLISVVTETL